MKKNKLFISVPMSSFNDIYSYEDYRSNILSLIDFLKKDFGLIDFFYAGLYINNSSEFESTTDAYIRDMNALSTSNIFLLIYPQISASGSLIELGYAIAKKMDILILTSDREILPYMIKNADLCENFIHIYTYKNDNLASNIKENKKLYSLFKNLL